MCRYLVLFRLSRRVKLGGKGLAALRIAVYTRKSRLSHHGESCENQAALCREYARRLFDPPLELVCFEDEGFSGKNTDRPQFLKMMEEIRARRFDLLICYRLDRISRSVADFTLILEELERYGVAFLSIRENFDTSSPMGRAMIHIASVFSQLERETIAERIRDNKYRLYRTGRWQGGTPPFGFTTREDTAPDGKRFTRLLPLPQQKETVRRIFSLYLEEGTFAGLARRAAAEGLPPFSAGGFRGILLNPVYAAADEDTCAYLRERFPGEGLLCPAEFDGSRGLIAYRKTGAQGQRGARHRTRPEDWIIVPGLHAPVIEGALWVQVQRRHQQKQPGV